VQLQYDLWLLPGPQDLRQQKIAEKIEIQTRYAAELYNVDVRQDQRYMAEHDIFPCGDRDESRFCPDFEVPLSGPGIEVLGDPSMPREISCVQILDGDKRRFEGPEKVVLPTSLSSSRYTILT
jgi:hypothetical protein